MHLKKKKSTLDGLSNIQKHQTSNKLLSAKTVHKCLASGNFLQVKYAKKKKRLFECWGTKGDQW